MNDTDELLGYAGIAALTGLSTATLRGYRSAERMPAPDVWLSDDRPRWRTDTIAAWIKDRPGRGAPGQPRRNRATR